MISKVFDGHSFYHACRYICNKLGAEVISSEGVRAYNVKYMADDFVLQAELRPSRRQACFHAALSFYPGEKLPDETMAEVGRKYLEMLGITDTQFAIVKHTDRAHIHLHIVANMVNNEGNAIRDNWIGFRGKKAAQQLTRQYRLTPATTKNLEITNLEALSATEANRYHIYTTILCCLPSCGSLGELEIRLKEHGIDTIYKYKGQTGERQGVSFRYGQDCFKGSKVDRKFSLSNLEKLIAAQQMNIRTQIGQSFTDTYPGKFAEAQTDAELPKGLSEGASILLYQLLKQQYVDNALPYELLREARKRKKKRR